MATDIFSSCFLKDLSSLFRRIRARFHRNIRTPTPSSSSRRRRASSSTASFFRVIPPSSSPPIDTRVATSFHVHSSTFSPSSPLSSTSRARRRRPTRRRSMIRHPMMIRLHGRENRARCARRRTDVENHRRSTPRARLRARGRRGTTASWSEEDAFVGRWERSVSTLNPQPSPRV